MPEIEKQGELFARYPELAYLTGALLTEPNLSEMLRKLAAGVTDIFPDSLVGILDIREEANLEIISPSPVDNSFPETFKEQCRAGFEEQVELDEEITQIDLIARDLSVISGGIESVNLMSVLPFADEESIAGLFVLAVVSGKEKQFEDSQDLITDYLSEVISTCNRVRNRMVRDNLTGLYNYGYLSEALRKDWKKSQHTSEPMGYVMLDIDRFKNINDSYGHRAGDTLIHEIGSLIRRITKRTDTVARYGGDELAIVMPRTGRSGIDAFSQRLLETVRTHVFKESGHPIRITISIGSACSEDPDTTNEVELLDNADRALYHSKRNGRNQATHVTDIVDVKNTETDPEYIPEQANLPDFKEQGRGKILVVDDDSQVLDLINRLLTLYKFDVITSSRAEEALEIVRSGPDVIDVMLTDINMPVMDGFQLIEAVDKIDPNIVIVFVTGFASTENTIKALRAGAYNLLQKPFDVNEMEIIVDRAVERRRLKRQLDMYHTNLEGLLKERTKALNVALEDLKTSYIKTMEVIVKILDIHETSTAEHSQRVAEFTLRLARQMGISNTSELSSIKYGALLHDIGKMGIPDAILKKPGRLTDEEMECMKQHPEMGYEIVRTIPILNEAAEIVYSHHEKFDGSGYPRKTAGKDICIGARIFAVADTYDALRYDRCYHKGIEVPAIVEEVNRCSGLHFDPDIVAAFNECYEDFDKIQIHHDTFWDEL